MLPFFCYFGHVFHFEVYIYNLIFILRCCYPIFFLIIRPFLDVLLFSLHFFVISAFFFRCRHRSKKFTQIQGCGITMPVTRWVHFSFYKKKNNIAVGLRSAFYTFVFFRLIFDMLSLFTVVLVHLSKAPIFVFSVVTGC